MRRRKRGYVAFSGKVRSIFLRGFASSFFWRSACKRDGEMRAGDADGVM